MNAPGNGLGIDRQSAAAEYGLDRIDDPGLTRALDDMDGGGMLAPTDLGDGMHIETTPPDLDGVDSDDNGHALVAHAELMDEVAEAFGARDIDTLTDLCAADCEIPGLASDLEDLQGAIADLWERRPTVTMTRSVDDAGLAVGVLWERDETASWAPVGTCHLDVDEIGQVTVLEFSDDVDLLEQLDLDPPDGDLDEGTRWEEWDEGVD